jgi:CRP-like cAMP-binding protein
MPARFEDILPILKEISIFAGLREEGLRHIVSLCETRAYAPGDVIVKEETPATDIYIIVKGTVKIVLDFDRDPLEICEMHRGDCVGEASVIGILRHSASAVAIDDVTVLALSSTALMDAFEEDKEFFAMLILNIARELARRLYRTNQILLQYATMHRQASPPGGGEKAASP